MKLIIDVDKDYYEMIKYNVEHGQEYKPFEIIANGIPYEPKGDLISREALKKDIDFQYICKCCHNVNGNVCDICPISEIENKIDNAPTVNIKDQIAGAYNDLISRSYLKNLPFERVIHTDFGDTAIPIEEIDNAPTVDIKDQIAGEWIYPEKTDKEKGYGGYCSNCKCDMPIFVEDWKQKYCETKFCPNCGAKMKRR